MAEKTLVLFEDTGDEAKINELASFMRSAEPRSEWEGCGSGIIITTMQEVNVGDTIVIADDGAVSVRRKS